MKIVKGLMVLALASGLAFVLVLKLPNPYQYELQDWLKRQGTPTFTESPESFSDREQSDLIREYRNRGHELECYGGLQREERIGKDDDYLCSAHIAKAYDGIPARLVTFFFAKGRLSHVRMEFPNSSFTPLQRYLDAKLVGYPRLDLRPGARFGSDNFGKPLMVWRVKHGLLTTTSENTREHTVVLLWSYFDAAVLDEMDARRGQWAQPYL